MNYKEAIIKLLNMLSAKSLEKIYKLAYKLWIKEQ